MKAYPWKKAASVIVLLILTAWVSAVLAQESSPSRPPFPPPAQWVAHGDYLYVLDMHSLHQYSLSDMRLKQTVVLPQPQMVIAVVATGSTPLTPAPEASLLVAGDDLLILEARSILKYQLPGLELVQSVTLPEPDAAAE